MSYKEVSFNALLCPKPYHAWKKQYHKLKEGKNDTK